MSDLPKCRLCGADAAVHKVFGGIKYCCSSETCTMHDVLMLKNQWRTLMTQQAGELAALRYTNDGALAECPCCGSLDVGGAHDTVNCYRCGLAITKKPPLKNAIDAWNKRALHTAPQAQPAPIPTAWQPIETAPEGVHVLVHYAKHITDLDPKWEWESDAQRTFVAMRNADYWVQDVGIGQSGIVEPTHWQPLPPAPGGSDD